MGVREALDKIEQLGPQTCYEAAEEVGPNGPVGSDKAADGAGIVFHAAMPGGKRMPLLKTLLTSACERDCNYCPFRAGRDFRRVTLSPQELAAGFDRIHRSGKVQGIFLSSGVAGGGVRTQSRLIETAEILRERYEFQGYVHLKLMPGAEYAQVERAMQLADRVSVNLEAPTKEALSRLAPRKRLIDELVRPLQDVERIRQAHGGRPGGWRNPLRSGPSQTTQFVVGPGGETDREILRTVEYLQRTVKLARTYFMAFRPVSGTPLEDRPPESPIRERRLYQSDFLIRDYGFRASELLFGESENLLLEEDPKLVWARHSLIEAPVEINTVNEHGLLRVPGIGPVGARKIVHARREGRLRELRDLHALGVATARAAPFILLDGKRPAHQLRLWSMSVTPPGTLLP